MSASRFTMHHIDFDKMTVEYLGEIDREHALHHPEGCVVVVTEQGTWIRSDKNPVWEKISDGKVRGLTIRSEGSDDAQP